MNGKTLRSTLHVGVTLSKMSSDPFILKITPEPKVYVHLRNRTILDEVFLLPSHATRTPFYLGKFRFDWVRPSASPFALFCWWGYIWNQEEKNRKGLRVFFTSKILRTCEHHKFRTWANTICGLFFTPSRASFFFHHIYVYFLWLSSFLNYFFVTIHLTCNVVAITIKPSAEKISAVNSCGTLLSGGFLLTFAIGGS